MSATASNRSVPWVPAAVAGVVAYLVEYLVIYLWQANSVRSQLRGINAVIQLLGGRAIPAWQAVGWLFYDAHFVAFTYPGLGGGRTATNLIPNGNAPQLLYVVPPIALLIAGYLVARYAGSVGPGGGAIAGAAVVIGYVVLSVIGVFAFRVTSGNAWVGPDVVTGILLAGVVYPVVLGGIGGAIAGATRR